MEGLTVEGEANGGECGDGLDSRAALLVRMYTERPDGDVRVLAILRVSSRMVSGLSQ